MCNSNWNGRRTKRRWSTSTNTSCAAPSIPRISVAMWRPFSSIDRTTPFFWLEPRAYRSFVVVYIYRVSFLVIRDRNPNAWYMYKNICTAPRWIISFLSRCSSSPPPPVQLSRNQVGLFSPSQRDSLVPGSSFILYRLFSWRYLLKDNKSGSENWQRRRNKKKRRWKRSCVSHSWMFLNPFRTLLAHQTTGFLMTGWHREPSTTGIDYLAVVAETV